MSRAATGLCLLALTACSVLGSKPPPAQPGFDPAESGATRTYLSISALREDKTDLAGALAAADKAHDAQPRSREAALRRAELLLALDHRDGVGPRTQEAREILAHAADDSTSLPAQARLAWNDGHLDDAAALLQRAAEAKPDVAHPQCLLAELRVEQGDADGARTAAERALAVDAHATCARRARARARLALGDAHGAVEDARAVLRASTDEVEARLILAEAYDVQGQVQPSISALEVVPARQRTTPIRVALARRELAAGRTDLARPLLEEALATAPGDASVLDLALALDLAATQDERGKRLGESIERLDAAAAAHPQNAGIARVRGTALAAAGRPEEAEASFARAIALDPDDVATYAPLADALLAKRSREQATARALELGLGPGPTQILVGTIDRDKGDAARAQQRFEEALRDPAVPTASRVALSMALASGGKGGSLERAVALAREAHAARPQDPYPSDALGLALLLSGKAHDAIAPLTAALDGWPPGVDAGEVRYHLALAYERAGDRDLAHAQATAAVNAAETHKPDPSWARDARQLAARVAPKPLREAATPSPSVSDAASASAQGPPPLDAAAPDTPQAPHPTSSPSVPAPSTPSLPSPPPPAAPESTPKAP